MGTKTEEEVAREAFKQELLHTSNWGLRRLATGPKGANVEVAEMKQADETGPEAVVELIMEKYDSGWRPGGPALNPQSSGKSETKKAPPKDDPPANDPPAEEESGNPWDDVGTGGEDVNLDGDGGTPDPEPDPEPPPKEEPKRQRRAPAKAAPTGETSALEEKVDKVLDTMMKFATVISKFEKLADSINDNIDDVLLVVTETKELNTVVFGGLFNRLSIASYGDVVKKAAARAKKACGIKD